MKEYQLELAEFNNLYWGECMFCEPGWPETGDVGFTVCWDLTDGERSIYPCTIVKDRYNGSYSCGSWLAFPLHEGGLPAGIEDSDMGCCDFWQRYDEFVGKGSSPQEAFNDLFLEVMTCIQRSTKE